MKYLFNKVYTYYLLTLLAPGGRGGGAFGSLFYSVIRLTGYGVGGTCLSSAESLNFPLR